MTEERKGEWTEGVRKLCQLGGSEMQLAGNKLVGTVVLTTKNVTFIPAYGPKQYVAPRSITKVELAGEDVILKSAESELARFRTGEREEREAWVKGIEYARGLAEQRGESIEEEMSAEVVDDTTVKWVYLAGNPNYPDSFSTNLVLKADGLSITASDPPLTIPYKDIDGFELLPSKQLTATRIFLAGPLLASAWKKMEWFLSIRYKDTAGISLSLVFEPLSSSALEDFIPVLYGKMREERTKHTS